ncbi:MAG TPA: carboxypeptidase-like regulatory domain-containing protein [Fluviicola sp.]|nr:carboxypeptidase-like regulatory domain-containing protein [Fluviicola sp.]
MKNSLFFSLSFLLIISLYSCKKKDLIYTITGTITDASFSNPLANATVVIRVNKNGSYKTQATLSTDSNGKYSYELPRDEYLGVSISFSKEKYFDEEKSSTLQNLSLDKENTFDFTVYAKSWVKIHLISDGSKQIKLFKQIGKSGCSECCEAGEVAINYVSDTSVFCINNGNQTYQFLYDVLNSPDSGTRSTITVPFDTTEIILNY